MLRVNKKLYHAVSRAYSAIFRYNDIILAEEERQGSLSKRESAFVYACNASYWISDTCIRAARIDHTSWAPRARAESPASMERSSSSSRLWCSRNKGKHLSHIGLICRKFEFNVPNTLTSWRALRYDRYQDSHGASSE